jgi:hypothetical protein
MDYGKIDSIVGFLTEECCAAEKAVVIQER